jgi:hypothetical protein
LRRESHCDFPPFIPGRLTARQPEGFLAVHHHTALLIIRKSNSQVARSVAHSHHHAEIQRVGTWREDQCDQGIQTQLAAMNRPYPSWPTPFFKGKHIEWSTNFERVTLQPTGTFYRSWMILKDLPKFQSLSSDVDVVHLSSLSEGSPGETKQKV